MDINKEREAFEKWVTNDGKLPWMSRKIVAGKYYLQLTEFQWDAWKARAEIEDSRNMQVEHKKG